MITSRITDGVYVSSTTCFALWKACQSRYHLRLSQYNSTESAFYRFFAQGLLYYIMNSSFFINQ
ncbi:hypothetical protein Plhal304r1_c050g0133431 [Plasmopara halstedii]